MTLRARVAAGLAGLLLLTTALAVYQLALTRELDAANRQLATVDLELSRASLRVQRHVDQLNGLTQRYVVLRDPGYVEEIRRLQQDVDQEIGHIESLPTADMGPIVALRGFWAQYVSLAERLEGAVSSGDTVGDELSDVLEALDRPREMVRRLDGIATDRAAEQIAASARRAATAYRVTSVVTGLGLALAAGLAIWIGRSIARPLDALTRGAEALSAGNFEHRVEVSGPRELAHLGRDFNALAAQLGELDRMKRDFVASVSHDLKAPLASIQETTRLLLEQDSELAPEQRRFLELSAQSAERLEAMIADLLDIARLEAGAVAFELEPLDLNDCCEQAIEQAAGLVAHRRLEIVRQLEGGVVPIRADATLLLQALGNLLSNAVKYSPEGGVLRITTRSSLSGGSAPTVRVEIEDAGPGVPDVDKERIFDRFYSSRASSVRPAGTGLGLAIARSIVEGHNGRIWVEDAALDGSVFIVSLPRGDGPQPESSRTAGQ